MAQDKVSQRYAKAIFDHLKDADKIRMVANELSEFAVMIEDHAELTLVLTSDVYSEEIRKNIVEDLATKTKISADAKKALLILSSAKRLDHLKGVSEKLQQILLESANVTALNIESATTLEAEEKKKIEEKFKTILGKKVEANYKVDPNLIGGLRVTAAGRTYDGSLTGWLNSFEENLISG